MGTIIALKDFRQIHARGSAGHEPQPTRQVGFTPRDRADLDAWSHNLRRAVVCSCDTGVFAMLYVNGNTWASWGVVRRSRGLVLWDCVTLADVGRFQTMAQALAATVVAEPPVAVGNVVRFTAPQAPRQPVQRRRNTGSSLTSLRGRSSPTI